MNICPNLSNKKIKQEFDELVSVLGENIAYLIWDRSKGNGLELAPNGEPSILFQTLLDHYNGDRTAAIKAKAKTYSSNFLNRFGDWVNDPENSSKVIDDNGEPLYSQLIEERLIDNNTISKSNIYEHRNATQLIKGKLDELKEVLASNVDDYSKIHALNEFNNWLYRQVSDKLNASVSADYEITFREGTKSMDIINNLIEIENPAQTDEINALFDNLSSKFNRKFSIEYVTQDDLREITRNYRTRCLIQNGQNGEFIIKVDKNNLPSYTQLAEEMLHPLIDTLYRQNKELFDQFYEEVLNDKSDKVLQSIVSSIQKNYTEHNDDGSVKNESVVQNEIVTQALAYYMKNTTKESKPANNILRFILDLLQRFGIKPAITGIQSIDKVTDEYIRKNFTLKNFAYTLKFESIKINVNPLSRVYENRQYTNPVSQFNDEQAISRIKQLESDGLYNLKPNIIESTIINSRRDSLTQAERDYINSNPQATMNDIEHFVHEKRRKWNDDSISKNLQTIQDNLATAFGLTYIEREDGSRVYKTEDSSKENQLRVHFVNSLTNKAWVDENGIRHDGVFLNAKGRDAAIHVIYVAMNGGRVDTFVHELAHYYMHMFWNSEPVQQALNAVDTGKSFKSEQERSKHLEEKVIDYITEKTIDNANRTAIQRFWRNLHDIINKVLGSVFKRDQRLKQSILDAITVDFSLNKDLSKLKSEVAFYEEYIGPLYKSNTKQERMLKNAHAAIVNILKNKIKAIKAQQSYDERDLSKYQTQLELVRNRDRANAKEVEACVRELALQAIDDLADAIQTIRNVRMYIRNGDLSRIKIEELMRVKTDILGYYRNIFNDKSGVGGLFDRSEISEFLEGTTLWKDRTQINSAIHAACNEFDNVLQDYLELWIDQMEDIDTGTEEMKKIYKENLKLWMRNEINGGRLQNGEYWFGPARRSQSLVVKMVDMLIGEIHQEVSQKTQERGHKLLSLYHKAQNISDRLSVFNFSKHTLCELDKNGKPTGYYLRPYNVGAMMSERNDVARKLQKQFGIQYNEVEHELQVNGEPLESDKNRDLYNQYYDALDRATKGHRYYKSEYYIQRRKYLSPGNIALERNIRDQIKKLESECLDIELGVSIPYHLSIAKQNLLKNLKQQLADLSSPYDIVQDENGNIVSIKEKDYVLKKYAQERVEWAHFLQGSRKSVANQNRYNEDFKKIKDKYGENSPEAQWFEYQNSARKVLPEFYDQFTKHGEDSLEVAMYRAARRSILQRLMDKQGVYHPHLERLSLEAFEELKKLDILIQKAERSSMEGFFDKTIRTNVNRYDASGNITNVSFYHNLEKIYKNAGREAEFEKRFHYTDKKGQTHALSIFSMIIPREASQVKVQPVGNYLEEDLAYSQWRDPKYDVNNPEYIQPDESFRNPKYDEVMQNPELKALYDELIQLRVDACALLGLSDLDVYKLPQVRDDESSMLFRAGFRSWMGTVLSDNFGINEKDVDFNENLAIRPDGSVVETIPIRWIRSLDDPKSVSTDVIHTTIAFYEMALNYALKKEFAPFAEAIRFNLQGGFGSQQMQTTQLKRYDKLLEMYLYGRKKKTFAATIKDVTKKVGQNIVSQTIQANEKEKIALWKKIIAKTGGVEIFAAKSIQSVQRWVHGQLMQHNFRTVLKNAADSYWSLQTEAAKGIYFTQKDQAFGWLQILQELGIPKEALDGATSGNSNKKQFRRVFSFALKNCARANTSSKVAAAMQFNGVGADALFKDQNQWLARRVARKCLDMGEYTLVDYITKGVITPAIYHNRRLIDNKFVTEEQAEYMFINAGLTAEEGRQAWSNAEITLWDAYDIDENGMFALKSEYLDIVRPIIPGTNKRSNKLESQIRRTIKHRASVINGMLDADDKSAAAQNVLGQALLFMRGWLPAKYWDQYSKGFDFYQFEQENEIEGFENSDSREYVIEKIPEGLRGVQYDASTGITYRGTAVNQLNSLWKSIYNTYIPVHNRIAKMIGMAEHIKHLKSQSRHDKASTKALMCALFSILMLSLGAFVSSRIIEGDDDDNIPAEISTTVNISTITERFIDIPGLKFLTVMDIVRQPFVGTSSTQYASDATASIGDIWSYIQYTTGNSTDAPYRTTETRGNYKGEKKWIKDAIKTESALLPSTPVLPVTTLLKSLDEGKLSLAYSNNIYKNITKQGNISSQRFYSGIFPMGPIADWYDLLPDRKGESKYDNMSFTDYLKAPFISGENSAKDNY